MRVWLITAALALGACSDVGELSDRSAPATVELPPMKTFAPRQMPKTAKTNTELARDFLELSFQMESGRPLDVLTRFEGPITVRLTGQIPNEQVYRDLDDLLGRMRREARVSITRVSRDQPASVTIETISRASLQAVVPSAACFVVPNVQSWSEFRRARRSNILDWARLDERKFVTIFLPGDVAPQEIRDCLHEELAQAIGPLNDLYRLPDSVFNDDNFHTVLTGFDMMMLRITYSPLLESGMTRAEVASRLPRILAAINPAGQGGRALGPIETPREWIVAVETALGPRTSASRRRVAAQRAVRIARQNEWSDTRMAFSLYILARLSLEQQSDVALASFFRAAALYGASDETAIQSAHIGMQLAAYALSSGDAEAAIDIVNSHLPAVSQAENAALLATLLLIKAEALTLDGNIKDAAIVRQDGLGWARYGFGSDAEVNSRSSEITSLRPTS